MDDRKLREYALNIYKGISGYTLNKAFSLFPKYYPKIAFYYTEILTKQQNEMSMRMLQGLGIDKGKALLNELNILTDLRFVLSVWPLILIGLGAEMLWFTSRDERVIYDKGAVFLMIGMSFFAMMLAAANICIKYSIVL